MVLFRYARKLCLTLLALGASTAAPAQAALTLCNRTSYVMDVAIGLEKRPTLSTRGWFRVEPGQCKPVLEETPSADLVYVHGRTPAIYGNAPLPQSGQAELCVRPTDFQIADARSCPVSEQVRFAAARPAEGDNGQVVNLAEQADYDDQQARLAGIQRLLVIAGYDASPIDGVEGAKTQNAINAFLKDRKLPADVAARPDFFATLLEAARSPEGHGFAWCNETPYTVMASLGIVEMGAIVTRGWYEVAAGQCLRPDLRGEPLKVYSYAEAVDGKGATVMRGGAPLAWGGTVTLCTRDGKFELAEHGDCASRGLTSAGFAAIEVGGKQPATVRFRDF
jgi:uncharacterized membrane protein